MLGRRPAGCRIGEFSCFSSKKLCWVPNGVTKARQTDWNHSKVVQNNFQKWFEVGSALLVPSSAGLWLCFVVFQGLGTSGPAELRSCLGARFSKVFEDSRRNFLILGRFSKEFFQFSWKFEDFQDLERISACQQARSLLKLLDFHVF